MQNTTKQTKYLGVDVAKNELIAAMGNKIKAFGNTREDCLKLFALAPKGVHIVCEASGGYENTLVDAAHECGIPISVVMPKRVRYYAYACGMLAKNDAIDAHLITRYAETMKPPARPRPSAAQHQLRALTRARQTLIETLNEEKSRQEHETNLPLLAKHCAQRLAQLETQLAELEQAIEQVVQEASDLAPKVDRITQIKGLGKISAYTILAEMPHIGDCQKGEAASAVGLAPHPNESGTHKGKRTIAEGNSRIRRVLYMAAVCAARRNPILSVFYQRLITRGKPGKVALVAVMRKLIELVNLILKNPNFILAR